MTCTMCGGECSYLGQLGPLVWWRCACCGMECSQLDATD
jgi:hypothetical protein